MKKFILSSVLTVSITAVQLFAGTTVVPPNEYAKINTNDVLYRYNYQYKKCERMDLSLRVAVIDVIRGSYSSIDEKFVNDAGTTWIVSYVDTKNNKEYEMNLMNTYGECRFFEDIMIKDIKDVDVSKYVKLKEK